MATCRNFGSRRGVLLPALYRCLFFLVVVLLEGPGPVLADSGSRQLQASACDITKGSWVKSAVVNKPVYDGSCPFTRSTHNCMRNGRKDTEYLSWTWKPTACTIPTFNALAFLAAYRNKVIGIAGDSFSSNFEAAILCTIRASTPTNKASIKLGKSSVDGAYVPAFNVSFLHLSSQYMVDAKPNAGSTHSYDPWTINLDIPDAKWKNTLPYISLFIFNSGHWFSNGGAPNKRVWKVNGKVTNLTALQAMKMALDTIGRTIQSSGFKGKAVFFTYSPFHYFEAYPSITQNCTGALLPFTQAQFSYAALHTDTITSRNAQVETLRKYPIVKLLDISSLSMFRPDGHVQTFSGVGVLDCAHWCLPGIPDTWTNILYKIIMGL